MPSTLHLGDCVKIPDGRIGRVRDVKNGVARVRVRRLTSRTHQFLTYAPADLTKVDCPDGWMSPEGYVQYLKKVLAKIKEREMKKRK